MKYLPLTVALVLALFGLCAAVPQTARAADEGAAKAALPAIHQAVRAEKIDDVKALLNEDARRVNELDADGNTPLHHAQTRNMAEFLIDRRANPGIRNRWGKLPDEGATDKGGVASIDVKQTIARSRLGQGTLSANPPPPRPLPAPVAARGQSAKQVFDAATLAAAKVGYEFVEGIQRGSHQSGARFRKTQDGQSILMQFSVVTLSGGGFRFTCITSAREPRYREAHIRAYRKAFFDGLGIESARNASFAIDGNLIDE